MPVTRSSPWGGTRDKPKNVSVGGAKGSQRLKLFLPSVINRRLGPETHACIVIVSAHEHD